MNFFLVDSNIFIRYFLQETPFFSKAKLYLEQAKQGKIKAMVIEQIIFEVEYVLRKVYKVPREKITANLMSILKMQYLQVQRRELFFESVQIYKNTNLDLVDIFLYLSATQMGTTVLSFDKDFQKLQK